MTPPESPSGALLPPPPAPLWSLPGEPEDGAVATLAEALDLPRALCGLLAARGWAEPAGARRFLRPLLDHLHPPTGLTDASAAADRLLEAVERQETILVHGDYDVDGVAAAALLTRWLRELGGRVVPFVPHRIRDGYDLGDAGLEAARRAGARVLLTVDCGIRAHEAVAEAGREGIDVIVTDHHTPGETLPEARAVVNPNRPDCEYPNKGLAGAGVAFKLCQLLAERAGRDPEALWPHLDLVALATVADLVPLEAENRVLVRFGLRALARSSKPGVRALLEVAGLEGKTLEAGHVGFGLAPRINAVGRMGDAADALELLLTEDEDEARRLAASLDQENRSRRQEDERILDEALDLVATEFDPEEQYGVVLASESWHPGVIGIVASRVAERIHRPVVLVALDGDTGRGSARSIPGFHLYEAVEACGEHLLRFGGHRQAAGMDLRRDAVDDFREAFGREARRRLHGRTLRPDLRVDLELPLCEASDELFRYLRYMGPFGISNPRPVFLSRGVRVAGTPRVVGSGHLKLRMVQDGAILEAIGFRMADRIPVEGLGEGPLEVVYQLRENEYRGRRTLQARLLDIRSPSPGNAR